MGDLNTWTGDQLLNLLGASDSALVGYFTTLSAKAKNAGSLYSSLVANGLPENGQAQKFAEELYKKTPRTSAASSATGAAAREKKLKDERAKEEQRKKELGSQKFSLMLDDDGGSALNGNAVASTSKASTSSAKKDKSSKSSTARKRAAGTEQDWEAEIQDTDRGSSKRRRSTSPARSADGSVPDDETPEEYAARKEKERLRDLQERDEFDKRMKARDKDKGKKNIVEDRTVTSEQRARRLLQEDAEKAAAAMPNLRDYSRQEYLKKREQQRIDLLRLEIQDFERDTRGQKLTKRELKELESKKEILRLTEERLRIDDGYDGYMMPEDYLTEKGKLDARKKKEVLYKRYEDNKKERDTDQFVTDLDRSVMHGYDLGYRADFPFIRRHEQLQTSSAILQTGALDRLPGENEEDYEYVFDDTAHIAFEVSDKIGGNLTQEEVALQAQIDAAEQRVKSIDQVRKSLPVYEWREELLKAIEDFQVLIIVGETGSGKTTQLPQFLHEAGYTKGGQKIGCTQPRRVAAMSVAARVAEEMGVRLGKEVGYSIRFEDCTSDKTVIKYMTDGMLLREFMTEPDLAGYNAMIIDEAHERTLSTDILLGLVKDIARFRPDFRLLISSATINAEKFSEHFDGAPIFNIPGRMYPVDIHYTPQPEANYLHAAITTVFQIHTSQPKGDILVFLTGQDEIDAAEESITETSRALGNKVAELIVCPIYANLPTELQAKIFEPTPPGARKVVLATNIAETSITIDGVVYVIDPGFVKQNSYNPRTSMESLVVVPVSALVL
jgi:pre-mRNA-splicing factor ATP-dependent RNA helicase DHX16